MPRHARLPHVVALSLLISSAAFAQAGRAAFDEGVRLMGTGEPGKAEKQFERAIAAEKGVAEYHLWLGRAVGQQAQTASKLKQPFMARRIKAEFEKAVELDPDLLDARDGLIQFYLQAPGVMGGSTDKAREQAREIAKRDPYRGHQADAQVAWDKRDTVATEQALRAAAALRPDSALPVILLAQRQHAWRRTAAAFETLDGFLARHPNDIAVRFQVGRLASLSGERLPQGERVLRDLLAEPEWASAPTRPTRAAVQFRLGSVLERSGRTDEARAAYEASLELDPSLQPAKDALKALK